MKTRKAKRDQRPAFFSDLWKNLWSAGNGADELRRARMLRGLRVETLEERSLLATYNWVDATNTLAITLAANEDLTISETGGTVSFAIDQGTFAPTADLATGNATATIQITNANLATSITVGNAGAGAGTNNVTFNGGTISTNALTVNANQGGTTSAIGFTGGITTFGSFGGNASLTTNNAGISDTGAGGINTDTNSIFLSMSAAGQNIVLDNPANDFEAGFVGAVSVTAANNVSLDDVDSIALGVVSITGNLDIDTGTPDVLLTSVFINGAVTVGGTLDIDTNANGGVGGSVIEGAGAPSLAITGTTTIDAGAGDVTLTIATNNFIGAVTITSGANASITDANDLSFGGASVLTGNLTVVAGAANAITDAVGATLNVGGTADFSGGSITLDNAAAHSFGSLRFNSAGAVSIRENNTTNLTGSNTALSLLLVSAGAITDAANTDLVVTNLAAFNGTSILIGDNALDVQTFGSLTFTSTGPVAITEDDATSLTGVSTGTTIVLTSAGPITDTEADAADEIDGTDLSLIAVDGIGASAAAELRVNVTRLDLAKGGAAGGIFVTDGGGGVNLAALSGPNSVDDGAGGPAQVVDGSYVRAMSPLTFSANAITATAGTMTYTASDSAAAGDDMTVNVGVTVQDTTGSLLLNVGDNLLVNSTSSVIAAQLLSINLDTENPVADPGLGSTARIFGLIEADFAGPGLVTLQIAGGPDNDLIQIDSNGGAIGNGGTVNNVITDPASFFAVGGAGGLNEVQLDDSGDNTADTFSLASNSVGVGGDYFDNTAGLFYTNLATLRIQTSNIATADGSQGDTVTVGDLNPGTDYFLDGNLPSTSAPGPGDTLILNPPDSITVYEIGGNYVYEFLNGGNLNVQEFETVVLAPGNGILNIVGDEGQGTNNNAAQVDEADFVVVTGTAQNAGTLQLSHAGVLIAQPPNVSFFGVTELNIDTFDLADQVTVTPFATTVLPWNIETDVDGGTGTDRIVYNNVAGLFDDTHVVATGLGAGRIDAIGVASVGPANDVVTFLGIEDLTVNANAGDDDDLTIDLTAGANTARFLFDPDVGDDDVQLTGLFDLVLDTVNYDNLTVNGHDGDDTFTFALVGAAGAAAGSLPAGFALDLNGGAPNASDLIINEGNAGLNDNYVVTPGADRQSGTVAVTGTDVAFYSFTGIENIQTNGGGGVGVDTLTMTATGADNAITLVGAGAAAGTAQVDGNPLVSFSGLGSGASAINLNGLSGSDTFSVTPGALASTTAINVAGGDPTASDTVIINGNLNVADTVSINSLTADGATVTGLGPTIVVTTAESLHFNGQEGGDNLTIVTPAGADVIVANPTQASGEGSVSITSGATGDVRIPISWQGVNGLTSGVSFTDAGAVRSDSLILKGTDSSDTYSVFNAAGDVGYGFDLIPGLDLAVLAFTIHTPGVANLKLDGLNGDDAFNVIGDHPFTSLLIDGGNPSSGSDTLNLTGSAAVANLITANLGAATITEATFGSVGFTGVETLNVAAAGHNFTVLGTAGSDTVNVEPTAAAAATITRVASTPAISASPVINASGIGATFTVNLGAGTSDTLNVYGTAAAETITEISNVATGTVAITGLITTSFPTANTEAIGIYGRAGADTINVTASAAAGAAPVFVDGGDPIGTTGDTLVLNPTGSFVLQAGPEIDEGGMINGSGRVSWDHIEDVTVVGGGPALVLGTNGDDDITVIARDASSHAGTDGVQDFTVTVNDFFDVLFINQPTLFIDALAGDDDIVVRAPAPNAAVWNVQITLTGGPAASPTIDQGDVLEVETPGAGDSVTFTPAGPDSGTFTLNQGTPSVISFVNTFIFDPAGINYTSSPGGIEHIVYDGVFAGGSDILTINGTLTNDTLTYDSSLVGSFRSASSPTFDFSLAGFVTFNGSGGFDVVNLNGSAGDDTVTTTAAVISLTSPGSLATLTIGTSVDRLVIDTGDGNDSVTLALQVAGLEKFVYGGKGNDTINLAGVLVNAADPTIYGGDGDDTIVGSPNPDDIFGGDGNDTITGGAGADFIYGQADSDTIIWNNGDGTDQIEGGTGNDEVIVNGAGAAAAAEQYRIQANGTHVQLDRLNLVPFTLNIAQTEELTLNTDSSTTGGETVVVNSLLGTELQLLTIDAGIDVNNTLTLNGSSAADHVSVGANPLDASIERVLGLGPIFDLANFAGIGGLDRLVINGLEGNDDISVDTSLTASPPLFTLNGGSGNDTLSAAGALIGVTLSGGTGNDILIGGNAIDTLNGDAGEDTIYVDFDGATDIITGGADYDTVLLLGTSASDVLSAFQSAAGTLATSRNGTVDSDTIASIERVSIEAGGGDDTIFVQHLDSLKNDAPLTNAVLFQVDGGSAWTADRLVVQDNGTSDVMIYRKAADPTNGSVTVAPVNGAITESLNTVFSNIEYVDPRTTNANNIFVFKYDPFEWNGNFQNATHLGAGTLNVDPVIDPGVPVIALPPGFPALPGADEDFYRIEAEVTGTLDVQAFFRQNALLPGAGNLDIQLLDASGAVIASDTDADDDARVRIAAVEGQIYFLRVFSGAPDALNVYSLTVINEAAPTPFALEINNNYVILSGDPNRTGTANVQFNPVAQTLSVELFVAGVELVNTTPQPQLTQVTIQTAANVILGTFPIAGAVQEPNGVRLIATIPFNVAANITALQNGTLFVDVDYTAPAGSIRGRMFADSIQGVSDTGRNQFDEVINDSSPNIFIRVADGELLNDVPDNGTAPGLPVDGDVITIPFVTSTATNAPGSGFRVAVYFAETNTQQPFTAGYAQPVPGFPGVYNFQFPAGALDADGSWFLSARVEMIDPGTTAAVEAQGFGAFANPLEVILDTTAPPAVFGLANNANDGLHPNSDTGIVGFPASFSDGLTSDTTPTFWGTAEANSIIRLFADSPIGGTLGVYDPGIDQQIAMTVALPFDGTNASPNGNWQATSQIDLNNPLYFPVQDGLRTIFMTAEDLAGNVNPNAANAQIIQTLVFGLDTLGPQITDVDLNSATNAFDLFAPKPVLNGPTPVANSIVISFQDLIASGFPLPNGALDPLTATTPGNYILKGDYNGIIPIQSITLNNANPVPPVPGPVQGVPANANILTATVTLTFFAPLPDDRYTLTIKDTILDQAGNALDGDTNAAEPQPGSPIPGIDGDTDPLAVPSGDLVPGTSFVARFTIDTRPEVGTWATGSVWVDLNGNTSFDPTNVDFTNRDVVYQYGLVNDNIFAGNFSPTAFGVADGWDKIASYGLVNGQYRFAIDTNNDGVPDVVRSSALNPNGLPVSGEFDGFAGDGDEVAVFTGTSWSFDTNHDYIVGDFVLPTAMRGTPIVGDFDGDGIDDLGVYQNDTFSFDLSTIGGAFTGNIDISFNWGLVGSRERPVVADMNMDGFDDIGLWQPDRTGVAPTEGSEWYWLISDNRANIVNPAIPVIPVVSGVGVDRVVFDANLGRNVVNYSPVPFGTDLYFQYGDEFALPIVGNFDPPPVTASTSTNNSKPYDVDGNGTVDAQDVLYTIVAYNNVQRGMSYAQATAGNYSDVDHDGLITPQDILYTIQAFTTAQGHGEGEADSLAAVDQAFADDDLFGDAFGPM